MSKTFLKAEWRNLIMANYSIDKRILEKYTPKGLELDLWNNQCYISLVGFMFKNTKVLGFKIPFHINFEEVNLRFYVKYQENGEWKRGVVFIQEIVPKPLLSFVANALYKENYVTMPMKHSWKNENEKLDIAYSWKAGNWNELKVTASNTSQPIKEGSEEEFITEHYWGYTKINAYKTSEYKVEHPKWKIYPIRAHLINVDFKSTYGKDFEFLNAAKPISIFLADGSEISVKQSKNI